MYTNMKYTAAIVGILSLTMPANAGGLSVDVDLGGGSLVDANIGIGDTANIGASVGGDSLADVNASVGGGSVADANVSVGGGSVVDADVAVGGTGGTGTGGTGTGTGGTPGGPGVGTPTTPNGGAVVTRRNGSVVYVAPPLAVANVVGLPVMSRDRKHIGTVSTVEWVSDQQMLLRVQLFPALGLPVEHAMVEVSRSSLRDEMIVLGQSRNRFVQRIAQLF